MRTEIEAYAGQLFEGASVSVAAAGQPRQLLTVRIAVTPAPTLAALLERAGGPPT